jgi:tetratricopeptide (TPR) repeat protein
MSCSRVRTYLVFTWLFMLATLPLCAQNSGGLSLSLLPGASIPIQASGERNTVGASLALRGEYPLPFAPWLCALGTIEYSLLPLVSDESLHTVALTAGGGVKLSILPRLTTQIFATGGYLWGIVGESTGWDPAFLGGFEAYYKLNPSFSLGLGGCYKHLFAVSEPLYQGIGLYLGARYNLSAATRKANIEIEPIEIVPVFPVFYKYYNDNPLGRVVIRNREKGSIKDIRVYFFIDRFMSSPKECAFIPALAKDEEATIPLYALFSEVVLDIIEPTIAQAQLTVEYFYLEQSLSASRTETVRLNHRNAMTWDDDRKAAAFVTAKDPAVLRYAKNIAGIIRAQGGVAVEPAFRQAVGLFESLGLFGLNYIVDPNTPYVELSKNAQAVDYLQFPNQTLEYRAGDCDDLSILYCALLESTGINTAFITVPGHIFAAFALTMPPEQAAKQFLRQEELIYHEGTVWLPVEITLIHEGFLKAWQTGAKQWQQHEKEGNAGFYPLQQAWRLYEPVALFGSTTDVEAPNSQPVLERYYKTITRFVEQEIEPRAQELRRQIQSSNNDPRTVNKLGVLYAQYGLLERAKDTFKGIVAGKEYVPALANLGNLHYLSGDFDAALDYYQRAYRIEPRNAKSLLGLARVNYELENYGTARKLYQELEKVSSRLAAKYAFLAEKADDATRAASQSFKELVEWDQE